MNKKKIIYVSACVIIDADDKILITSREHKNDFSEYWEFPGGKIEINETPEECIIRELKEELNIDASNNCIAPIGFSSFNYEKFHVVLMLFVTRKWSGNPIPLEGNKLKWVSYSELRKHKMPDANKSFLQLENDNKSVSVNENQF